MRTVSGAWRSFYYSADAGGNHNRQASYLKTSLCVLCGLGVSAVNLTTQTFTKGPTRTLRSHRETEVKTTTVKVEWMRHRPILNNLAIA
jgi:hypothetical protein